MMYRSPASGSAIAKYLKIYPEEFFTGNVTSNKDMEEVPEGVDALKMECSKLSEENHVLKRCLRLMRDNSALETASLLSAVVAFCDGKFRRRFADGMEGMGGPDKESLQTGEDERKTGSSMTQTSGQQFSNAATGTFEGTYSSGLSQETEGYGTTAQAVSSEEEEEPVRDRIPRNAEQQQAVQFDKIHEIPERDGSSHKKGRRPKQPVCPAICPKSPPVSLGGRQIKSPDINPYFYPSEPSSKHLRSHMQTKTPFISDLEYDALYLRSLALAAGYRALAKGLGGGASPGVREGGGADTYPFVSMDRLCRTVSGIPPYIMYMKKKNIKPAKLIHTCVTSKPTRCYPFSREGQPMESAVSKRGPGKHKKVKNVAAILSEINMRDAKVRLRRLSYETDERALRSPLAEVQQGDGGQLKVQRQHRSARSLSHSLTEPCRTKTPGSPVSKRRATWGPGPSESQTESPKKSGMTKDQKKEAQAVPASAGGQAQEPSSTKKQPPSPRNTPDHKGSDYDFQAVVEPIIEQARQSLGQVSGTEPLSEDLTSFSLKHTHKEYTYQDDGSAVVVSDIYKKSYNWSSDEEGGEKEEKEGEAGEGGEGGGQEVQEVAEGMLGPETVAEIQGFMKDATAELTSEDENKTATTSQESDWPTTDEEVGEQAAGEQAGEEQEGREGIPEEKSLSASDHSGTKKGSSPKASDSGHVHWDPTTFETRGSQHLADVTRDVHPPRKESGSNSNEYIAVEEGVAPLTGQEAEDKAGEEQAEAQEPEEEPPTEEEQRQEEDRVEGGRQEGEEEEEAAEPLPDSSNNKTNNYINLRRQKATLQWLETNCGTVSRDTDWANHCSRSSPFRVVTPRHHSSHSSTELRRDLPRLSGLESLREVDLEEEVSPYSPNSINSWPQKSEKSPATRWLPSPRQDFFPVQPQSGQTMWVTPITAWNSKNLLGEVAFQLERRILDYVFANSLPDLSPTSPSSLHDSNDAAHRRRYYGYSVSNIGEMINHEALAGENYSRGTERMLREKLRTMLDLLTPMGYDLLDHGAFSQDIINKYGLLSKPPVTNDRSGQTSEVGIPGVSVADVQNFIFSAAESDQERDTLLLIFDCLRMLAIEDGRSLFVW